MNPVLLQLCRYVVTGGLAAIVDVGGFAILIAQDVPIVFAATSSFALAAICNYVLSSWFVFDTAASMRRFALFLSVAAIGLCINVGATVLLDAWTPLSTVTSKIGGIAIAFLANFTMNRMFVFVPSRL